MRAALEALRASFDAQHGGFGGAPKFPHPTDLELCLRKGETRIVDTTLRRMCEGGIYDQLGGGFCRYSVDAQWMIPHFEKMLYDNGPLLQLLADAWLVTGDALYARCAEETAGWIVREMQSPEGGYYSSLDADSEHEEGKFYVWDAAEARALLSAEEWAAVAPHYGLDGRPNFEERHWHLHVAQPLRAGAEPLLASARAKLFAAREPRVRPGRDEKVLVSWNALAMRGMAHAGRVFGKSAVDRVRTTRARSSSARRMWRDGRLLATCKDGRAHLNAYLDDYAYLIAALLELLQDEYRAEDLEFAESLAEVLLEQFEDREAGGFYFTARDHEQLIHRPKPGHDNAMASGNGMAAYALNRLAALTGEARYARAAERTLELFHPSMREHPSGYGMLLACARGAARAARHRHPARARAGAAAVVAGDGAGVPAGHAGAGDPRGHAGAAPGPGQARVRLGQRLAVPRRYLPAAHRRPRRAAKGLQRGCVAVAFRALRFERKPMKPLCHCRRRAGACRRAAGPGERGSRQEARLRRLPRGQGREDRRPGLRRRGEEVRRAEGRRGEAGREGEERRHGRLGPGADAAERRRARRRRARAGEVDPVDQVGLSSTQGEHMRHTKLALACIAAAALAGCGKQSADIKIGHVGPITGGIAHLGKDNENGARLAIEQANEAKIKLGGKEVKFVLVAEDDQADPKVGTTVAQKLVDAKVAGVVGHLNSGTSIPGLADLQRAPASR